MAPDLDPAVLGDHIDRLYRAAWALCGSRDDAEDLVQETFAHVLARPRDVRGGDPLGYLLQVLRNTYFSSLRTRARRPRTTPLDEAAEARLRAPGAERPDQAAATREVFATIAALPEAQRDVVTAVDVAGLSYGEAAHALGVPAGTVMSRLARGRDRVAQRLGG